MKKIATLFFVLMLMLASFTAGVEYQRGDVDQNGQVNIADVVTLIDYLLTGTWDDEPVTPPDEHEWVDLGLPSGTLWATCNVGAWAPDVIGNFFAWGETEPKEVYNLETYKWSNGGYGYNTLTKYCTDSSSGYEGFVDNKTELDPEDDAAYMNWGPSWRMPTKEQQQELIDNCTWTWTYNGILVTGPNGNSLFLPAGGYRWDDHLSDTWSLGSYWSRTLESNNSHCACSLNFYSEGWGGWNDISRPIGYPVRAVRVL